MDPLSARATLQIDPTVPLSASLIESAFEREAALRAPSRYPDDAGRRAALAWRARLDDARAVLLAQLDARPARARRGLGAWPTVAIVGGALVVVAGLAVAAGFGAVAIGERLSQLAEEHEAASVQHYQPGETLFTFPASLEYYADGRLSHLCDPELAACWEGAVFTNADCSELTVHLGYWRSMPPSDGDAISTEPDVVDTVRIDDVLAYEQTPVVFGDDRYELGAIVDLTCSDPPGY
ncbi:hypothetical protein ACWKWP_09045 [Agromyces soli]